MTADEAAFLARIREEPDADLPRLVFADWLDERGYEARARFLRAHVELASLATDSPRRRQLAWECRQYIEGELERLRDVGRRFAFDVLATLPRQLAAARRVVGEASQLDVCAKKAGAGLVAAHMVSSCALQTYVSS